MKMSSSVDNTAAVAATSTVPSSSSSSSSPIPSAPPAPANTDFGDTNNPSDAFTNTLDSASMNGGTSIKGSYTAANDMMKSMQMENDAAKQNAETSTSGSGGSSGGSKKDDSMFECNICLDTAKEAVVSMCGHLFCWPCLHQWLETRPTRQLCPVCKAAISKEKVVPLYGRGSTKEEDPR